MDDVLPSRKPRMMLTRKERQRARLNQLAPVSAAQMIRMASGRIESTPEEYKRLVAPVIVKLGVARRRAEDLAMARELGVPLSDITGEDA